VRALDDLLVAVPTRSPASEEGFAFVRERGGGPHTRLDQEALCEASGYNIGRSPERASKRQWFVGAAGESVERGEHLLVWSAVDEVGC
jgi:hypothetical protein